MRIASSSCAARDEVHVMPGRGHPRAEIAADRSRRHRRNAHDVILRVGADHMPSGHEMQQARRDGRACLCDDGEYVSRCAIPKRRRKDWRCDKADRCTSERWPAGAAHKRRRSFVTRLVALLDARRRLCHLARRRCARDVGRRAAAAIRQHHDLGAERHAIVEIRDVLVGEADAARRHALADGRRRVGAVDAEQGIAEIHGARAERIARAAGHEARQVRLAVDHLLRRMPVRPFLLARD